MELYFPSIKTDYRPFRILQRICININREKKSKYT